MEKIRYSLRTNIGFMLNKPIGFSREFNLHYDEIFIDPDLDVKDLSSTYRLSRTSEGILFDGTVSGQIEAQCVRCLESHPMQIEMKIEELFFFPNQVKEEWEQVIPDDGYIDLGETFRDYLLLGVPIQNYCKPDCLGICLECGQNLNHGICEHTDQRIKFEE
ncbi:MAG: YceD family protein [Anaerolineaceae bacterium]|jgi:uncharacterized protein